VLTTPEHTRYSGTLYADSSIFQAAVKELERTGYLQAPLSFFDLKWTVWTGPREHCLRSATVTGRNASSSTATRIWLR
jgi:hypothetical protein